MWIKGFKSQTSIRDPQNLLLMIITTALAVKAKQPIREQLGLAQLALACTSSIITSQTAGIPNPVHPGSKAAGGSFPEAHQQVLEVGPLS